MYSPCLKESQLVSYECNVVLLAVDMHRSGLSRYQMYFKYSIHRYISLVCIFHPHEQMRMRPLSGIASSPFQMAQEQQQGGNAYSTTSSALLPRTRMAASLL